MTEKLPVKNVSYEYKTAQQMVDLPSTTIEEIIKGSTKSKLKNLEAVVSTKDEGIKGRLRLRESVTPDVKDTILTRLNKNTKVKIISDKVITKLVDGKNRNFVRVDANGIKGYLPAEYLTTEIIEKKLNKKTKIVTEKENEKIPYTMHINEDNKLINVDGTKTLSESFLNRTIREDFLNEKDIYFPANTKVVEAARISIFNPLMRDEVSVDISEDIKKYDFYINNLEKKPVDYIKGLTITENIDFSILNQALSKISVVGEKNVILNLIKSGNIDIVKIVKLVSENRKKEAKQIANKILGEEKSDKYLGIEKKEEKSKKLDINHFSKEDLELGNKMAQKLEISEDDIQLILFSLNKFKIDEIKNIKSIDDLSIFKNMDFLLFSENEITKIKENFTKELTESFNLIKSELDGDKFTSEELSGILGYITIKFIKIINKIKPELKLDLNKIFEGINLFKYQVKQGMENGKKSLILKLEKEYKVKIKRTEEGMFVVNGEKTFTTLNKVIDYLENNFKEDEKNIIEEKSEDDFILTRGTDIPVKEDFFITFNGEERLIEFSEISSYKILSNTYSIVKFKDNSNSLIINNTTNDGIEFSEIEKSKGFEIFDLMDKGIMIFNGKEFINYNGNKIFKSEDIIDNNTIILALEEGKEVLLDNKGENILGNNIIYKNIFSAKNNEFIILKDNDKFSLVNRDGSIKTLNGVSDFYSLNYNKESKEYFYDIIGEDDIVVLKGNEKDNYKLLLIDEKIKLLENSKNEFKSNKIKGKNLNELKVLAISLYKDLGRKRDFNHFKDFTLKGMINEIGELNGIRKEKYIESINNEILEFKREKLLLLASKLDKSDNLLLEYKNINSIIIIEIKIKDLEKELLK